MTAGRPFWFTEAQVREMYEVKLESEFLDSENISLSRMIVLCDSISAANKRSKEQLQYQLVLKERTIDNFKLIVEQEQGKFKIADESLASMKRRRTFFVTTTVVAITTTVLLLIFK